MYIETDPLNKRRNKAYNDTDKIFCAVLKSPSIQNKYPNITSIRDMQMELPSRNGILLPVASMYFPILGSINISIKEIGRASCRERV